MRATLLGIGRTRPHNANVVIGKSIVKVREFVFRHVA